MALVAGGRIPSSRRGAAPRPAAMAPYGQRARSFVGMFVIHFALAGIAAFGAAAMPSAAWAYVALFIFLSMCLGLLGASPVTFLLFVPLLASRITEFMSGAAIESGAFMIETYATGSATGAFTRYLLINLAFFLTVTLACEAMWPRLRQMFREAPARWERQAGLIWIGLVIVIVAMSLYLLRLGLNNGFPLFNSIDRFVYLEKIDSPIYQTWMANRLVFVPFVGALFALPSYRGRALLVIGWFLASSIIFGEKFGSILMILSVVTIPAGLVHIANDRAIPIRVIGAIGAAIIVITVPAVLIAYGALRDFDAATERYGQRVALQGQLWFVTDQRYITNGRLDDQALSADVASWVKPGEQDATQAGTRFGLYYVMQRFTSSRMLGWTMEAGNGFIGSLYPYLLISTTFVGLLIVSSIIGLYHAVIMRLLAASFAEANWVAALCFSRIMSSFYATYTTGYLWNIFGVKTIATLVVGLFIAWEFRRPASSSRTFIENASRRIAAKPE